ncbi:TIGR03118 family protein [Rhodovastum atsumiense]|uniref:TIGR03118 family protein n=2 Tax=Rhodovastum atsumiense TaxID=504468 RepID=A0A5M6IMJ9_9PROT|nr:TIGR03118 family protein [Rhodovastum atsumiense]
MGFIRPAGRGGGVDASRPERGREVTQANLVSDGFVRAAHTDGHLINPWGVSFAPGGPFWISDNGSGVATIHDGTGRTLPLGGHAAITIAAARGSHDPATPTGQVFNSTGSGFGITAGGKSAASVFLFATEDGTISGWNPRVDAGRSVLAVDGSGHGAVYKGLAMAQVNGRPRLYAADFRNSRVDIFDSRFAHVGSFTDPSLPKGYAPFNVQALGGRVFVTFALQDADRKDDVAGAGHGYVDEFDTSGHMVRRIASGGPLNSPWGLDIAPAGFGSVGGDLLVGNFGDGTIDAFDLGTDHFIGRLLGTDGRPLVIGDLWALTNGNGGNGGDPGKVYFTAGVQDEAHGLFGSLSPLGRPPPMPGHGMSPYA